MAHIWKYRGCEFAFDISDSRCMKRMNDALEPLKNGYDAIEGDECRTYEAIERVCGMIGGFFAALFGEEYVKPICGDGMSFESYTDAYVDFIIFVNDQLEALSRFRENVENRLTEKFASRIADLGGGEK